MKELELGQVPQKKDSGHFKISTLNAFGKGFDGAESADSRQNNQARL